MEDLWKVAFPFGTRWNNMDKLHELNWKFPNLENAFKDGGELCGKKTYLFCSSEAPVLNVNGMCKRILIPIVVAVVSSVPPSHKIGIISLQHATEDIIPIEWMKMEWMPYIPYIPSADRQSEVERLHTEIYALRCTLRRSDLKHLKVEQLKLYEHCLPYLPPLVFDADEHDTVVQIMYPLDPPVISYFDWELDDLEKFTEEHVIEDGLCEDQMDKFKEFVKAQVEVTKQARRKEREARRKAIEDMDPKMRYALENMRFYKFYPVQTPDTPDISKAMVPFINIYYGKAHVVL